jgi:hypothetical protein
MFKLPLGVSMTGWYEGIWAQNTLQIDRETVAPLHLCNSPSGKQNCCRLFSKKYLKPSICCGIVLTPPSNWKKSAIELYSSATPIVVKSDRISKN